MKAFVTKENKTGGNDSGTATTWGANEQNSANDELVNVVDTTGQTPTAGTGADSDTTQLAQAVNIYAQTGHAYQDTGIADAYVLTPVATLEQPSSYYNGSRITFTTSNLNTGASTVNVSTLGVKKILDFSGNTLSGGEVSISSYNELIYDAAADAAAGAFILNRSRSTPGDDINLSYEPTPSQMISRRMLQRNGASLLDTDYPELLAAFGGKIYGNVDGAHFNLPDDRGLFERMWDNGAVVDPDSALRTDRGDGTIGDNVGTVQPDDLKNHSNEIVISSDTVGLGTGTQIPSVNNLTDPVTSSGASRPASGGNPGNETRPTNRYKWGGIFYVLPFIMKLSYYLGNSAVI